MSEKGFKMHRSLQIYMERTYVRMQSVVCGGNPRYHRFFVREVALIFRLAVGTFASLAAVGFLANWLILGSPKLHTPYLTYCSHN